MGSYIFNGFFWEKVSTGSGSSWLTIGCLVTVQSYDRPPQKVIWTS